MAAKDVWNERIRTVREKGLGAIVGGTMERWFTKDFRDHDSRKVKWISDMFLSTRPEGFIACAEAENEETSPNALGGGPQPTRLCYDQIIATEYRLRPGRCRWCCFFH